MAPLLNIKGFIYYKAQKRTGEGDLENFLLEYGGQHFRFCTGLGTHHYLSDRGVTFSRKIYAPSNATARKIVTPAKDREEKS